MTTDHIQLPASKRYSQEALDRNGRDVVIGTDATAIIRDNARAEQQTRFDVALGHMTNACLSGPARELFSSQAEFANDTGAGSYASKYIQAHGWLDAIANRTRFDHDDKRGEETARVLKAMTDAGLTVTEAREMSAESLSVVGGLRLPAVTRLTELFGSVDGLYKTAKTVPAPEGGDDDDDDDDGGEPDRSQSWQEIAAKAWRRASEEGVSAADFVTFVVGLQA